MFANCLSGPCESAMFFCFSVGRGYSVSTGVDMYTVFHQESKFQVTNSQLLQPGGKLHPCIETLNSRNLGFAKDSLKASFDRGPYVKDSLMASFDRGPRKRSKSIGFYRIGPKKY